MPAGPGQPMYEDSHADRSYTIPTRYNPHSTSDLKGDESAASILQSVKEQEAQFEQLTRELEAERQSVAHQLERCKLGSETASMSSISSTDESFHWRPPPPQDTHFEEESDAESKMSGSQLVDSCLSFDRLYGVRYTQRPVPPRRVLQERGLMNVGSEDPLYLPEDADAPPRPPPSSEHFASMNSSYGNQTSTMNGPTSYYDRQQANSPNPSLQSGSSGRNQQQQTSIRNVTTVTKVTTTRQTYQSGGNQSPVPQGTYSSTYSTFRSSSNQLPPPSPAQGSQSPVGSQQGRGTPTRSLNNNDYESYSQLQHPPPQSQAPPRYLPSDRYDRPDVGYDSYDMADTFDQQYPYNSHERGGYPYGQPDDGQKTVNNGSHYGSAPYAQPDDSYRATPPIDDSYRQQTTDMYSRVDTDRYGRDSPAMEYDRYHQGQPVASGDLYGSDPRYADPSRYTAPGRDSPRFMPPLEDDQYSDAQPSHADRYGQPLGDSGRPTRTPSPGAGSQGYNENHPYGSQSRLITEQITTTTTQEQILLNSQSKNSLHNRRPGEGMDPHNDSQGQIPYLRGDSPRDSQNGDMRGPYGNEQAPLQSRPPYDQDYPRFPEESPRFNGQREPPFQEEPTSKEAEILQRFVIPNEDSFSPEHSEGRGGHSPSLDSHTRDQRWRNPDLPEVIDFLSHPSNAIKANAAAYLQHLSYMDDPVKAKTRTLGGIPALVDLVTNDIPEVHRSACGALRNLSYGRANDDNKKAIKNAGGIPALVRLLRKSPDNDVRELVTGILWNLSSCQELKKPIIDEGLTVLVNNVVIPHSGWDRNMDEEANRGRPRDVYWSTVFRNASGVLRNISSDGEYARKKLRECEGLVDGIMHIVNAAIGKNDIDNKSVENCVCVLRNLSYACQEVEDPAYLKRRAAPKQPSNKGETTGCFGGNKKKKDPQKIDPKNNTPTLDLNRPRNEPVKGMELLWQPEVVNIYLPLLSDCSNPETLEAAAGAIQNLAACDWQPSVDIRAAVRKERGLPIIVELLSIEADRVVSAAATALRNLALDQRNKELIGKYAMKQLVQKLPTERQTQDFPASDDTITAVQATLYEVVKKNGNFAQSLLNEGGVERLVHINRSRGKYNMKVVKFASSILYQLWQFKELHVYYKEKGYKETDFVSKTMAARGGPSNSANNTLNRPRMDLGGGAATRHDPTPNTATQSHNTAAHGPNGHTYTGSAMPPMSNHYESAPTPDRDRYGVRPDEQGYGDDRYMDDRDRYMDDRDRYMDDRLRSDNMAMAQMGSASELPPAPGYASIEANRGEHRDDYRPPGGVPLFPNLPPGYQQPQPQTDTKEPLYAQVNKHGRKRQDHMMLEGGPAEGGADSWV